MSPEEVLAILNRKMQEGIATPEQIEDAVNKYLEKNPIEVEKDKVTGRGFSLSLNEENGLRISYKKESEE